MDGNTGNHLIMNLILRPLADVNDVTWSVIWCLVILLAGVVYYIVYIMRMAFDELNDGGSNQPEGRRSGSTDSTADTQD
jgi:hypothetical protein